MTGYLAYFDYLGYAQMIKNNSLEEALKIQMELYKDAERAMQKGRPYLMKNGKKYIDYSTSNVSCYYASDTIIFYTQDTSEESFEELMELVNIFNYQAVIFKFPVRGAIVKGEFKPVHYHESYTGCELGILSVTGTALLKAYKIAEETSWAGCVLDSDTIELNSDKIKNIVEKFCVKFPVPFNKEKKELYALRLLESPSSKEYIENIKGKISRNFTSYNKGTNDRVNEISANTLEFVDVM
jgi:hypothetical protein